MLNAVVGIEEREFHAGQGKASSHLGYNEKIEPPRVISSHTGITVPSTQVGPPLGVADMFTVVTHVLKHVNHLDPSIRRVFSLVIIIPL